MRVKILATTFIFLTLITGIALIAGTLTNNNFPAATGYTLTDIHNLIHNTPASGHNLYPSVSSTATSSYSISELYADLTNLIDKGNLKTGVPYLGVTGDYDNFSSTTPVEVISSSLTPTALSPQATGYTLTDIYNLIHNATTTPASTSFSPGTPAASQYTLDEIYTELSTLIDPLNIKKGITYLGTLGTGLLSNTAGFFSGDGTPSNPYQITNWTQLDNIRKNPSANYILNSDLSSSDSDYISAWLPIGTTTSNKFTGNFDGQNHTISDLSINLDGSFHIGLFGYSAGNISNLNLANANVTGGTVTGGTAVGGMIGYMSGGGITSSSFNGNVTASGGWGTEGIGGLVGSNSGGTISKSYTTGSVSKPSGYYISGLVGYNHTGNISNSYSTASVTGYAYVYGLVGLCGSGGTISNSYAAGTITGTGGGGPPVGGLMGSGNAVNSFFDKESTGQTAGLGIGTTTTAMQTQSTFTDAGWDFSTIWTINEGASYPTLLP